MAILRVHYPAGSSTLGVRGEPPLRWDVGRPMTNVGEDTWETHVELSDGVTQLEWKPLLDDRTWSEGYNYVTRRDATSDVWPHFTSTKGTVEPLFERFHSNVLGNDRVVWVYLPPSYAENPLARYPVLYMQDGQNLFSTQPTLGAHGWQVDVTLDAATHDASLPELIVVAPEHMGAARKYEYTPTKDAAGRGGGGDRYLEFLVDELKPQVDKVLRTRAGRATTAIVGSSLGGLISVHAATTRASTYGLVGALSPSTWWDDEVIVREVDAMNTPRPDKIYVDCGTSGTHDDSDGVNETRHLFAAFERIGYVEGRTFEHLVEEGGVHSETYWAQRLPGALRFLFGPRV